MAKSLRPSFSAALHHYIKKGHLITGARLIIMHTRMAMAARRKERVELQYRRMTIRAAMLYRKVHNDFN